MLIFWKLIFHNLFFRIRYFLLSVEIVHLVTCPNWLPKQQKVNMLWGMILKNQDLPLLILILPPSCVIATMRVAAFFFNRIKGWSQLELYLLNNCFLALIRQVSMSFLILFSDIYQFLRFSCVVSPRFMKIHLSHYWC